MRRSTKASTSVWTSVAISLLALGAVSVLGGVPAVHAVTPYTVSQSWCTSHGGTWTIFFCALPGTLTINSGDSLDIPSGVALLSNEPSSVVVNNNIITIEGTLETSSFDNHGTFTQTAGGTTEVEGVFNNYGSVSISGSNGIIINLGSTFNNYGSFADSTIFHNDGTFNEGCPPATFDSTSNTGVGTYVPPTGCTTTGAPEFPLGFALLFAVMIPALLVLRKKTLSF